MNKKTLGRAILLGLALGGMAAGTAWAADYESTETVTATGSFDSGKSHAVSDDEMGGNYTAHWTGGSFKDTDGTVWGPGMQPMNVSKSGTFKDVKITLDGYAYATVRGLVVSDGTVTVQNYIYDADLIGAALYTETVNPTALMTTGDAAKITVEGDTNIKSHVEALEGQGKPVITNNGVYAFKGTIELKGNTYVNTIIPEGFEETYKSDYRSGMSTNDALTARNGATLTVNPDGGKTVQILGNMDVKGFKKGNDEGGTINVRLDTADSYWHGEERRDDTVDNRAPNAKLNVTLANYAQWLPDKETTEISALTLEENGIINMHGSNMHVNYDNGLTKDLTIHNLTTSGGIIRMDVNADKADTATGKNGSDFVTIKGGSGDVYVQPVLANKADLEKITKDNPVWFSDAAEGITFKPYLVRETIEHGYLYDYQPVVDKNIVDADASRKTEANAWYLTGATHETTPTADTVIADSGVNYATATARLEIDSLNKRLGELRNYEGAADGAWARFKAGELEGESGSYFKDRYTFWQVGWDKQGKKDPNASGRWHRGVAIHYTDGEASYRYGKGDNKSYGVSLYAGWEGNKGHYADYVLKYSHLKNEFTAYASDGTARGEYSDYALSASAEYGKKNTMSHKWMIEPQAQLIYTYINGADYTVSNGIRASQDSVHSLIGRAGFRLGREFNQNDPAKRNKWYLKADVLHEFGGDRGIDLWSADGTQTLARDVDGGDTWFVWGFGGDTAVTENTYVYCDFEKSCGGDIDTNWQVNLGLRYQW